MRRLRKSETFHTYNWLVGVRAVDWRKFNHEVAFPFNRKEAAEALAARVRAVRRINPDYWYEVESLSSEERADNEAINTIAPGMM